MTHPKLKIAVAQFAPEVGDMEANLEKLKAFHTQAKEEGAELTVFPELSLTGYTLGDEIPRYALTQSNGYFEELLTLSKMMPLIVGYIERSPRGRIYNTAALLDEGRPVHIHRKVYLPNYGVCKRVEQRPCREIGPSTRRISCNDYHRIDLHIGETDVWARNPLTEKKLTVPYT